MAKGAQKQGKHKKYGPKMANPRIKASKEHRSCGPLGYYNRLKEEYGHVVGIWPGRSKLLSS